MESSDPPRKSNDEGQCDRNQKQPDVDSMTLFDRSNALRSHRIRFEDAVNPNSERVTVVQSHDVVLGRGKRLQGLPGNTRMRCIVLKYSSLYHTLNRAEKRRLLETVYQEIIHSGARFLLKAPDDQDFYLVIGKEIALQKVSNILRSKKPKLQQTSGCIPITATTPRPDPVSQQSIDSGRMDQAMAMAMNPQMAFGSEAPRLPMNPLRSPLDALASLPVNPMYRLPTFPIAPAEQVSMAMMANHLMEQNQMIRNVMTMQRLNTLQESSRAAALYSQSSILNGALNSAAFPPLVAPRQLPQLFPSKTARPNEDDADKDKG